MTLPIAVIAVTFNAKLQLMETTLALRAFRESIDQFIVVDGASSDGTRDFIANSDVVTSWVSEPDAGIYDAMNKGWALANEDNSILYLGAGDKLLSLPDAKELDSRTIIYGDVLLEGSGVFSGKVDWRLKLGNTLHHQALLIPKRLHPTPPFNCRYPTYADYDFNLRLLRQGASFGKSTRFKSSAATGGVSYTLNDREMSQVVGDNFGPIAGLVSRAYLRARRLRPNPWQAARR